MRHVTEFPNEVRIEEHVWIPLPDGSRVGARIWLPVDAETRPVPAVLEYLPYRKRDLTRARDSVNHPYIAGHGFACVRVDMRGSGESDGLLVDEYCEQELQDGVDVIGWISRQPWCDGAVGMMGISWGGFNSLQIAARAPEALKAIISCCASDDLYEDNMHYMGGCLLGDHLSEATVMFAFNSQPPDPELVGERWREIWLNRLKGSGLWLKPWLEHQRRDAYWRNHSVCEDYSRIKAAVLAVGGWTDGYTNAIFRLMENVQAPCRGLIGPWGHRYPHVGIPGPAMGFLQEVVRWFDHWLKGEDRGVERDPKLRLWLQDSVPPSTAYEDRPGRWVAEPAWPSPNVSERVWQLGYRRLAEDEVQEREETVCSPLSVGQFAGKWCSYSALPDLPHDQREEDGGSLIYDTEPLEEDIAILGMPYVDFEIAADRPVAQVAVRLSDVRPDGRATRITYGVKNLTHRDSDESPEPLEPGRFYHVCVRMNGLAHLLPKGHSLRLSVSSSYFPLIWAAPEPGCLKIRTAQSRLVVPERRACEEPEMRPLGAPEGAPPMPIDRIAEGRHAWRLIRDLVGDVSTLEVINDEGTYHLPEFDMTIRRNTEERYSFRAGDHSSLRGETFTEREFRREGWRALAVTSTTITSDVQNFHIHARLDAFDGDRRIFSENWAETFPRDLV